MDDLKKTMEQAIEPASKASPRTDKEFVKYLSEAVYLGFTDILLRHGDTMKRNLSKVENETQKSIDKTTKNLNTKVEELWKSNESLDVFISNKEQTKVEKLDEIITLLTSIKTSLQPVQNTELKSEPSESFPLLIYGMGFWKWCCICIMYWGRLLYYSPHVRRFLMICGVCIACILFFLFGVLLSENGRLRGENAQLMYMIRSNKM